MNKVYESVSEYYGETLQGSTDLKTSACCTAGDTPGYLKTAMANIHPDVQAKYYGCGLVAPQQLEGLRILDLGSGSGRDCYLLAQLVGEQGFVLGVDMTAEQLAVAREHREYHRQRFGYAQSNVDFVHGHIEELDKLGLEDASFDLIISNCVINLSPDKAAVLREAHRLLKPGGEMYFSDVYADRRVPAALREDPVLYGECLGGALYWNDFHALAKHCGFADPRLVEDHPIEVEDPEQLAKTGLIRFWSATYRLFRLDDLEPACEDYGQAVIYRGDIPDHPHFFALDKHHCMATGKVFPVCGNTWRMLHDTRFAAHFDFIGDGARHYGIFEGCGSDIPYGDLSGAAVPDGGCGC